MMLRSLVVPTIAVCCPVASILAACASDTNPSLEEDRRVQLTDDAGDGGSVSPDAADGGDSDAGECEDCEYFVEQCAADILCATGPFDPSSPDSLDRRAQVNVITGRSRNDVWVIGALGAAAHFDGTSWTRSDVGGKETLRAMWLRSSAEVTFGTLESIYTRGIEVQEGEAPPPSAGGWLARGPADAPPWYVYDPTVVQLTAAWAAPGADRLWCTTTTYHPSENSGLWRFRISPTGRPGFDIGIPAVTCRDIPCSQLTSIHGRSASELWAVGYRGAAVHMTGADTDTPTLSGTDTQTFAALFGVWVSPDSEVWAVGARGTIRRHAGDSDLWDVVTDVPTTTDLRAVSGSSDADIWAVGNGGVVLHYDGAKWTRVKVAGLGPRRPDLTAVWVPEPGHVWIGGTGVILSLGGLP